jgi:hypothetical protein
MFVPFAPQRQQQWPWLMGVYAREEHFSGTIRAGQQHALVLAIATSVVITLAASMLSRHSFEELAVRPFDEAKNNATALSAIVLSIDGLNDVTAKLG